MTDEIKEGGLWNAKEVAAYLKVDPDSVYRWVAERRIPFVKIGRLTRFRPADIERVSIEGLPAEGDAA